MPGGSATGSTGGNLFRRKQRRDAPEDGGGGLPGWLKRKFNAGKDFDRANRGRYPYNEVEVEVGGENFRLDSYDPGKEVVFRRLTQLADVDEATALKYVAEFDNRYPTGARITNSQFNSKELRGTKLSGRRIFEVPPQKKPVPIAIRDAASRRGMIIRDPNGKVYNP